MEYKDLTGAIGLCSDPDSRYPQRFGCASVELGRSAFKEQREAAGFVQAVRILEQT